MTKRSDDRIPALTGPLTVSQLTSMVARAIRDALPTTVHVIGEISNFKRHSSGHIYLTLKDAGGELACVMWRSDAVKLKFTPADGLEVVGTGAVELFERAGRYQLYMRRLEPRGVGALELAFRQLCAKLDGEGLFDPARKKPLPRFPRTIVLVTSPTGAAVADMLRTIERRFPCIRVLVYPVKVQGDEAAGEIASAIGAVNTFADRLGGVDLMIVGRGGGSLEDLWAFNEETVARAIFGSRIPIISAVGHEVDVTVADLVADVRAATPTAAAELAVPVLDELLVGLDSMATRLFIGVKSCLQLGTIRVEGVLRRSALADPHIMLLRRAQALDEWAHRMQRFTGLRCNAVRARVEYFEKLIQRIAPHAFLLRLTSRLASTEKKLLAASIRRTAASDRGLVAAQHRLERSSPMRTLPALVERSRRACDLLSESTHRLLALNMSKLGSLESLLNAVGHRSVLNRGYSITRLKRGSRLVRSAKEVLDGDRIVTETADGQFESEAVNIRQLELFEES